MSRARRSLALGLALVAIGVTAFLHNLGLPLLRHAWSLWPLFLIAAGLFGVRARRRGTGLRAAERALVVMVAVGGLATTFFAPGPVPPRPPVPPPPPIAPDLSVERDLLVAKRLRAEMDGSRSLAIDATGVEVHLVSWSKSEVQATLSGPDATGTGELELDDDGDSVRVRSRGIASGARLILQVPERSPVQLRLDEGAVHAQGIGDLEVEATASAVRIFDSRELELLITNGSLVAKTIDGDAQITATNTTIALEDLHGDATVRASFGDVTITSATGSADVETSFAAVVLRSVRGDVRVRAPNSHVRLERLAGAAEVETTGGSIVGKGLRAGIRVRAEETSIEVVDVIGDVDLQTTRRRVVANRVRGAVRISSREGSLTVRRCTGPVEIDLTRGTASFIRNTGRIEARVVDGELIADAGAGSDLILDVVRTNVRLAVSAAGAAFDLIAEAGSIVPPRRSRLDWPVKRSDGVVTLVGQIGSSAATKVGGRVREGVIRIVHE